jgi:hypothetical protein
MSSLRTMRSSTQTLMVLIMVSLSLSAYGQQQRRPVVDTMGMGKGVKTIETPNFTLKLGNESGVAINLLPKGHGTFDFLPSDRLQARWGDGFVHLGDINIRTRLTGSTAWQDFQTYKKRSAIKSITPRKGELAAEDLAATLGENAPIKIIRRWSVVNNQLQLSFEITNITKSELEIGGLGIPMPFNNIIMDRSLEEAHAKCSFTDPYIGADAGYLRVTRLDGVGPTMLVTPIGKTPLEAWHLVNEPMRPNQVFEGMMEWTVHTKAFAENEWKGVEQWVSPTSAMLRPGETRTYGVQFTPSKSIRAIDETLQQIGRPVAVGFPGYILPMDNDAKLFLKYSKSVQNIKVEPAGSIVLTPNREGKNSWKGYSVKGKKWGRSRVTVTYSDGTAQVVSYTVIKPESTAVADLGNFLTTKAWFTDKEDPFGRAPAAISYDREVDAQVRQDSRVWIAGLGDEGGSGNWLALAMKEFGQPKAAEVEKFEEFVNKVIWGNLQFDEGPKKYGVRKSVFYYDPKILPDYPYDKKSNWTSWTSWNLETTNDIGRGYNYPHVVAAYWSLYRIARNHPSLVKTHDWNWYLNQAYETTNFLTSQDANGHDRVGYMRLGLMDGSIFVSLLEDLRREGWTEKANLIEERMKMRADRWADEAFPFGSEMAWDSTGQEEVYMWCKQFGFETKAQVTLNSILAYDPTVPHWGYNGNARRYWDFLYGGKLSRIERQIHHYGSGLNAIPLLREFRENPDDLYLLRVGYGGTMGALSNIDEGGFASAAFHSFPSTLKWDAYSGDYGPNFFGHAFNTCTYLVQTKDFGWQAFGGNISVSRGVVTVKPTDSFRKRIYIAPAGLYLTLDAGQFTSLKFDSKTGLVTVQLAAKTAGTPNARLVVASPSKNKPRYEIIQKYKQDAGAFTIPLDANQITLTLKPVKSK